MHLDHHSYTPSVWVMSFNRNFSVSPVSATSERHRLPQKGASGTRIEDGKQLLDLAHVYVRHIVRGIPKEKSTALRQIASSTLSRISEVDDEQSVASNQLVHCHAGHEHFSTVQPLRSVRRKTGQLNLISTLATTPATMMTDARDLFEEYGIDRPPG